jgi:uncharacterized protein (DUF983 family)
MENQQLWWKDDIPATCPHCGNREEYTAYLNADSLICNVCDKEFDVALYATNVEWKAR